MEQAKLHHSPLELWHELHEQQGDSLRASRLAEEMTRQYNWYVLLQPNQAEALNPVRQQTAEYPPIAAVTALAAAKQVDTWDEAREPMLRALRVQTAFYPYGQTKEEAVTRGNFWQAAQKGEDYLPIRLRESLHLVEVLQLITADRRLGSLSHGMLRLMEVSESGHRYSLIHQIEAGPDEEVWFAYHSFMKEYGFGSKVESPTQIVTVSSRFMGRAIDWMGSYSTKYAAMAWLSGARNVIQAVVKHPQLGGYAAKEVVKNVSFSQKQQQLAKRVEAWKPQVWSDPEMGGAMNSFLSLAYIGLGNGQAVEVKPYLESGE